MKINVLSIILFIALIASLCFWNRSCTNAKQYQQMTIDKSDTLMLTRNISNEQVATIGLLQGSVSDLKKLNVDKDINLLHLQKITNSYTISADVLNNSTSNTIISNAVITPQHDTIRKDSLIYVYPVYTTNFSNAWEKFEIDASRSIIKVKYKVFNDFDIVTGYNKPAWYKLRIPEITVTNKNPNTETLELKSFIVMPPKNQKLFIFLGGFCSGIITTAYINSKLK